MIFRRLLSSSYPLFLALLFLAGCGSSIGIVATVGNETISRNEFEDRLRTALGSKGAADSASPQLKRDFIEQMVRLRLELLEAKRQGLPSDSSIERDVAAYRLTLAQALLLEKELIEPRLHELYRRKLEELHIAQIMFQLHEQASPAETLEVYRRAMHLVPFIPIVGFDALARQYSEDTVTGRHGGDAGWITGGTMENSFESAAYTLRENEYTKIPVRTSVGYHLIKVLKRQPARGALHLSHIVLHFARDLSDTAAVRDTAWKVYTMARSGADFAELARKYSDERMTKLKGGDMGYFERDEMRPELSNLLYGLPVDSIPLPQHNRYAFQIYKITGYKGIPSYEEMHNSLRTDYEQMYYQNDYIEYIRRLSRTEQLSVVRDVWNALRRSFDPIKTPNAADWSDRVSSELRSSTLLRSSTKGITVGDFLAFLRGSIEFRDVPLSPENLDEILARFTERLLIDDHANKIPVQDPEFPRMVEEYKNSRMVERLEKQEILNKAVVRDSDVRALYDSTKELYRWPDRVNFAEIYVATDTARLAVIAELARGDDFLAVARRHTVRTGYSAKSGIWGLEPDTANPLSRMASTMAIDSVTDFFEYQNGLTRIKTLAKEPARLKTFDEVRPELENICRNRAIEARREDWIRSLKTLFGVSVNPL